MLLINLESRMKNKTFWIALLGAIVLLSQQCGFDLTTIIPKNYVDIINTVFLILTILGVVVDTSTPGISDIAKHTTSKIDGQVESDSKSVIEEKTDSTNKESEVENVLQIENAQLKAKIEQLNSVLNPTVQA